MFVPYELGFEDEKEDFAVLDHIIDVFFLLDIILNFRTGFIDDGGRYGMYYLENLKLEDAMPMPLLLIVSNDL